MPCCLFVVNQVTEPGRRIIVGWLGNTPASQSLSRDLSLGPNGELLQRFVPELSVLRVPSSLRSLHGGRGGIILSSQQAEVYAEFTVGSLGSNNDPPVFGLTVLRGPGGEGTNITVDLQRQHVNVGTRAGPLLGSSSRVSMHVYIDHTIVEVIVNNQTALTYFADVKSMLSADIVVVGAGAGVTASVHAWKLKSI